MKENFEHITIKETSKTSINVKQSYYLISEKMRLESLFRIIDARDPNIAIIFCQTKKDVDNLLTEMNKRGYNAKAMHGDIAQSMRLKTLDDFKNGHFNFLIATDVAARGIHVDNMECVINYNLPGDVESYIHRIGRTGRSSNTGEAISLVNRKEVKFLSDIEKIAKCQIIKKELPITEEIIEKKYLKIIELANEIIQNKQHEECIKYVRDMNKEDLIKFSAALLKNSIDNSMGSDLTKDITVKDYPVRNKNKNTTRVFLTIGKMDKLKKGTLLDFLKKNTGINKEYFSNIDIVSKFTFMDIDNKYVKEAMKKIHNTKLNNRIIRIEIAKNK